MTQPSATTYAVGVDPSDPANPTIIVRLTNSGIRAEIQVSAAEAPQFWADVAETVATAARRLADAQKPRLVTPAAAGQLLIPPGGIPRAQGRRP